jgi:hypothetical protein
MKKNEPINELINIDFAVFKNDLEYIKQDMREIKDLLSEKYVMIETFEPVRKIVYGLTGIMLVSIVSAIMMLIFKK